MGKSDDSDWHPRQVAITRLGDLSVSTVLVHDGSCFETKVFGPGEGGLEFDYEIQTVCRDQAMMNHCVAADRLRRGLPLKAPPRK